MPDQLRMYTIKPGEMVAWLEEWTRLIAPLRRARSEQWMMSAVDV